jgi:RecA-family ATPase
VNVGINGRHRVDLETFLGMLHGVKMASSGHTALCPAHDDSRNSLSISKGDDGKVLVHCHAGCSIAQICQALDVPESALFATTTKPTSGKSSIVAEYDYHDEAGRRLYQTVRFFPKDFRQRRWDGSGWVWGMGEVRRVLYRLPEVIKAAQAGRLVYVCEGEKDADALRKLDYGVVATTAPMGAGKWQKEYAESLRGAHVVCLPDNDPVGLKHMDQAAANLVGVAASVKVLCLPNIPPKGDVSDWIAAGGTAAKLFDMQEAAPEFTQPTTEPGPDPASEPETKPGQKPPLRPADVAAMLETVPPAQTFVFEDVVPAGVIAGVDAQGGTGKSWLTQTIVASAASGETLLPAFVPVQPVRVLWLSSEDPEAELHRRFAKLVTGFNLDSDAIRSIGRNVTLYAGVSLPLCQPAAGTVVPTEHYEWLVDQVHRVQPGLIVLDPRSSFFAGNENSNTEVGAFMNLLRDLLRVVNGDACVWVNHHTSKEREDLSTSAAGRGASAARDAMRVLFNMTTLRDTEVAELGIAEENKHLWVRLENSKQNWCPRLGTAIYLRRETGELGGLLRQVDTFERKMETRAAILEHLAARIAKEVALHEDGVCKVNLVFRPEWKDFRDQLKLDFGKGCNRKQIELAIEFGLGSGVLLEQSVGTGANPKRVLLANFTKLHQDDLCSYKDLIENDLETSPE